ncbi:MAG: alpha/beta hydrolase [Fidelibacterota bacterium]
MKTPDKLDFDTFLQGDSPQKAVITIHGWKGNRTSFQQICRSLNLKNVQWFFPEAPYIVDNEDQQRSWSYEISEGKWETDKPRELFNQFFTEQIWPNYSPENVYVIGFSQGALMCLEYILMMDKPLGGVFPISGFLLDPDTHRPRFHPNQLHTPILIGHGKDDDIVPLSASQKAYKILLSQGANVKLLVYGGKHKIGLPYLTEMKKIIQNGT